MINLYLVRHGIPKSDMEDPERPLSDQGRKEIEQLAEYARAHLRIHVTSIQHSGKLRALQTAEILRDAIHPPPQLIETDGLKPLDDVSIWAGRLSTIDEDVMLVGHMPFMSRLVSDLLLRDAEKKVIEFTTGGIVRMTRDGQGAWSLKWCVNPRIV